MFGDWIRSAFRVAPLAACLICGGLSLHAEEGAIPSEAATGLTEFCQQFTEEKLVQWQQQLGLEKWHVTIILTKRADLKPKTLGGIRCDKGKHTAVMNVMHPDDYKMSRQDMLNDMEETVVHELIHLKLTSMNRSEAARSREE